MIRYSDNYINNKQFKKYFFTCLRQIKKVKYNSLYIFEFKRLLEKAKRINKIIKSSNVGYLTDDEIYKSNNRFTIQTNLFLIDLNDKFEIQCFYCNNTIKDKYFYRKQGHCINFDSLLCASNFYCWKDKRLL